METTAMQNLAKPFGHMPIFLRAGLVIFAVAGSLDLSYHTLEAMRLHTATMALENIVGADAYPVHVVLFSGMALILLGVLSVRGSVDDA
jgi:hypothetical protein